jgi:tetratricopeptide (TPR) repeat protein
MKKSIIFILGLIPLLTFSQANRYVRQALNSTDLNEKIELFTKAIELDPEKLDAYFYRGIVKNDLGDYYGAIVDYSKVIVEEPDADTYFNRGNARYSLEDFEGAKEDYKKAIEIDPYFVDALFSLGCANYDLGDYDSALIDFNKVIKIQPYYSKAYNLRANILSYQKKHKEALKDYTMGVLVDPNADTYYNRGVFYMEINYYKKAKSDFTSSLRFNANNGFAYFYRGASHLLLGKFRNAVSDFTTALKFDELDFDAMLGLSMAYYQMKDIPNTKLYLNKAKQILQTNTDDIKGIELYKNTYWYQNQFYFFNEKIGELNGL